jgi:imidazoleglycerol-phosphate dehydratase
MCVCGPASAGELLKHHERIRVASKYPNIAITLNLDGSGKADLSTGIGFFDHMLDGFARHGFFDLDCTVKGDLQVDGHHTVEDTGIVLGEAIKKAVGDKKGINRYGYFILPMDDVLALCAVDLSGRPYLNFECEFTVPKVGALDTELVKEFFYAVSYSAGMNLHIKMLSAGNNHHMIEAMFKAFAKALDQAVSYNPKVTGILSTKGSL